MVQIFMCSEETKLPGYPECATGPEIETFLLKKRVILKIISEQVDFTDRDERAVRSNEIYVPSVPISADTFSDIGIRYRYN